MDIEKLRDVLLKYAVVDCNGFFALDADRDNIFDIIMSLKERAQIDLLMDLTCVDYPGNKSRFRVLYNFLSLRNNIRVIVRLDVDNQEEVASIHEYFPGSVWYEREIYDMFGIKFKNCPDHRRILTDESFDGHPLRKDFPVMGYVESKYDIIQQKVVEVPVDLSQDYRRLDNLSPWLGSEAPPANNKDE